MPLLLSRDAHFFKEEVFAMVPTLDVANSESDGFIINSSNEPIKSRCVVTLVKPLSNSFSIPAFIPGWIIEYADEQTNALHQTIRCHRIKVHVIFSLGFSFFDNSSPS